ncbi:MAG: rhodanese-like domain-containing protein [Pseudomonadales bacterium]
MKRAPFWLTGAMVLLVGVGALAEPMTIDEVVAAARADVDFVGNAYLKQRLASNPDLVLLDVRSESEFAAGHIPHARSVPRGVAEFSVARSVRSADTEIVVYCRTGSRAALVTKALLGQGYHNVRAHDGFETWEAEEPVEVGAPAED